jgi:hypothetical protein
VINRQLADIATARKAAYKMGRLETGSVIGRID